MSSILTRFLLLWTLFSSARQRLTTKPGWVREATWLEGRKVKAKGCTGTADSVCVCACVSQWKCVALKYLRKLLLLLRLLSLFWLTHCWTSGAVNQLESKHILTFSSEPKCQFTALILCVCVQLCWLLNNDSLSSYTPAQRCMLLMCLYRGEQITGRILPCGKAPCCRPFSL